MIEVKDLTRMYGAVCAVDHVSFTIDEGKVYGFLGPNGAGKSTTMNMMTGYLLPTEGQVLIDGIDIAKEPKEAKKKIGYLPEVPPLYPDMTVREFLMFAAELKGVPKDTRKERVAAVMEELSVTEMQNRLIRGLSKGYRQRVGFAEALVSDPEMLILDEPTVGLDPKQIIEIRELIRRLGKTHTVLLSSHILSEVTEICDEVMILSHGRLVAYDTPENLERMAQGESRIELVLRGTEEVARRALSEIVPEEDVSVSEDGDLLRAVCVSPQGEELRGRIARSCVIAGLELLELRSVRTSLESVFLELTEDTAAGQPEEEKNADGTEKAETEEAETEEAETEEASGEKKSTDAGEEAGKEDRT